MGRGTNGAAFLIDGIVAKIATFSKSDDTQAEVARLEKAKGIAHVVQVLGSDSTEGIILTELLPGRNIGNLNVASVPMYTNTEILELVDIVISLHTVGLAIDPKPGNFMYDTKTGFYLLDPLDANDAFYPLPNQIMGLMHMLTYTGKYKEQPTEQLLENTKQQYRTMLQLLQLVKESHLMLYRDIQDQNTLLVNTYGKNAGYLKDDLFEDDRDVISLREKIAIYLTAAAV